MAHLGEGEVAGDQEADGTEGVGPPDGVVEPLGRGCRRGEGVGGADVEEEGPDRLDGRRQPIDPVGGPGGETTESGTDAGQGGVVYADHLSVLEQACGGEE